MKTLHLMRHGKSSWKFPLLKDEERPLRKKGAKNTLLIAKKLAKKNWSVDLWVSSPAVRAYETAKIMCLAFQKNQEDILIEPKIYEAGIKQLVEVLRLTGDEFSDIIWFGHEPGFSLLTHYLTGQQLSKFPTSAFVSIQLPVVAWSKVEKDSGKIVKFIYPKMFEEGE